MYFWMVRLLTLIPSLSSSPRMRSAPHSRPRAAMSRIRLIVSRGSGEILRDREMAPPEQAEAGAVPTQNGLGLHEDDRSPPRRQPARTEEQLQSIDEVELRAVAVASQDIDLVAKHGVLENQLPAGPDRIHGDVGDLARRSARGQLRPQPLHASQNPRPDSRNTRQAHPPLGAQTR